MQLDSLASAVALMWVLAPAILIGRLRNDEYAVV